MESVNKVKAASEASKSWCNQDAHPTDATEGSPGRATVALDTNMLLNIKRFKIDVFEYLLNTKGIKNKI